MDWKSDLLKKTKDLTENFNIDIETCLTSYLTSLQNIAENLQNELENNNNNHQANQELQITNQLSKDLQDQLSALKTVNFAEAATVIGNSAAIYSRKVDFFELAFKQTVAIFKAEKTGKKIKDGKKAKEKELEQLAGEKNGEDQNGDDDDDDDNEFLSIPEIKINTKQYENLKQNLKLTHLYNDSKISSSTIANSAASILSRKPSALIDLDPDERGLELKHPKSGNSIGYFKDFYTNRAKIDARNGCLLMDHTSEKMMEDYLRLIESCPEAEVLPINRGKLNSTNQENDLQQMFQEKMIDRKMNFNLLGNNNTVSDQPLNCSIHSDDMLVHDPIDDGVAAEHFNNQSENFEPQLITEKENENFEIPDFNEVPSPELNDSFDAYQTAVQEKQTRKANMFKILAKKSFSDNPKIQKLEKYEIPIYDRFQNSDKQENRSLAQNIKMLVSKPLERKKSAIIKFNALTFKMFQEEDEKKKAEKRSKSSSLDDSTANTTINRTISQCKPMNYDDLLKKYEEEEPLDEFMDRMKWDQGKKKTLPSKNANYTISYPELENWYWEEIDRKKSIQKSARRPKNFLQNLDESLIQNSNSTNKKDNQSTNNKSSGLKRKRAARNRNIKDLIAIPEEDELDDFNNNDNQDLLLEQKAIYKELEKFAEIDETFDLPLQNLGKIQSAKDLNLNLEENDNGNENEYPPMLEDIEPELHDDQIFDLQPPPEEEAKSVYQEMDQQIHQIMPIVNAADQAVENQYSDLAETSINNGNNSNLSFADLEKDFDALVRRHVDEYYQLARKFAKESDLDKRVREWSDDLEPYLETLISTFDIHGTSDTVLRSLDFALDCYEPEVEMELETEMDDKENQSPIKQDQSKNPKRTRHISSEHRPWYVIKDDDSKSHTCQRFFSLLQLANNGNVELVSDFENAGSENFVDSLQVRLKNRVRLQERFDEMDV